MARKNGKKSLRGVEFIDPTSISCYCKKVLQERLRSCVLTAAAYGKPGSAASPRGDPQGQGQSTGQT